MLRHGRTDAKGGPLARCPRACKTGGKGAIRREANMPETASSAAEAALENQKIGSLQLRVAALCTLVQICDGYDLNSVAWAVPSLIRAWHLPPALFTTAFLWSSIGIMVGALSAGPIGDRFGRRPLLLGSLTIFGIASLLTASAGSLEHADAVAVLHRHRHWRRLFRRGRVDRRLHAASAARDHDHGHLHRRAGGWLHRRPARRGAAAAFRLAGDLRAGRRVPAGAGGGAGRLAAGVAALPGQEAKPVAASDGVAAAPRHRPDAERSGRRRARQSGGDAVQRGLCAADRAAVDHLLLQPDEPVPVRLLDADGAEPDRHDAAAGGVRLEPAGFRRDLRGALSRPGDRPDRDPNGRWRCTMPSAPCSSRLSH